jgi:coiled-coil and C2 domain-containing protein 2A
VSQDVEKCKLVIQLQSGLNLPLRNAAAAAGLANGNGGGRNGVLKPFVEMCFQRRKICSGTGDDGSQPLWNQSLAMEIQAPEDDFRPEALMETDIATDIIYINLFDEITVDMLENGREREREMYIRKERVSMGSIEIPFPSIWERSRIDGKFPIKIPPSLLGYTQDPGSSDEIIQIDPFDQPLLHIFITLDPPLRQPPVLSLKFQSKEEERVVREAERFQEISQQMKKDIVVLTHDMNGKSTLVCRYIHPQTPPPKSPDPSSGI